MEDKNFAERLNILRAGVLGANDGIISIAGVVIGVASATSNIWFILISALSAIFAGAFSMAGGEYVLRQLERVCIKPSSVRGIVKRQLKLRLIKPSIRIRLRS